MCINFVGTQEDLVKIKADMKAALHVLKRNARPVSNEWWTVAFSPPNIIAGLHFLKSTGHPCVDDINLDPETIAAITEDLFDELETLIDNATAHQAAEEELKDEDRPSDVAGVRDMQRQGCSLIASAVDSTFVSAQVNSDVLSVVEAARLQVFAPSLALLRPKTA